MGERESKTGGRGTRVIREREREGERRREKGRVKARGREGVLEYKKLNHYTYVHL